MQRSGLADKADLRRTVRTVVAKFVCLCRTTKNEYGKFVCSSNRKKGESIITEINIEWMIRKKKAQIRKRKRETCNRIEFTFSVVSTYPPTQYNTILPAITAYACVSSRATEHYGCVHTTPATQAHVEPTPRPEESYRLCVSMGVIRCNPLHLKWVRRGGQTKDGRKEERKWERKKKERKKERKKDSEAPLSSLLLFTLSGLRFWNMNFTYHWTLL
jgi:hypothetical protein